MPGESHSYFGLAIGTAALNPPFPGCALTIPSAQRRNNRHMELRPPAFFLALKRTGVALIALVLGLMIGSIFANAIAGNERQPGQSHATVLSSTWSLS